MLVVGGAARLRRGDAVVRRQEQSRNHRVHARDDGDAPVGLAVSTTYGSKSIAAVQPGKSTTAAFTTRQGSITGGTVGVAVTAGGDSAEASASYAAATCG